MKISIDIDCTPEEARRFLGLPDVTPLQDAFLREMEKQMMSGLQTTDPETFRRYWPSGSFDAWEKLQKAIWEQMVSVAQGGGSPAKPAAAEPDPASPTQNDKD